MTKFFYPKRTGRMVCLLLFFGCKALFDRLWKNKSRRNQIVASFFFIMSYRFITLTNLSFVSNWLFSVKWMYRLMSSHSFRDIDSQKIGKQLSSSFPQNICVRGSEWYPVRVRAAFNVSRSVTVKAEFVFFWAE